MSRAWAVGLVCVSVLGGGGCTTPARDGQRAAAVNDSGGVPSYAEVAAAHNARAARLGRLWSRAAVQLRYTDAEGTVRREQGEGHLQIVQPANLALSVGKLGEVVFWLGSDAERFWWFDLGDASTASVGRHENAMKPCIGELPLPVHPLDLLDLIGVTPLPASSATAPVVGPGGRVVVDVPARAGVRRLFFDASTMRPVRVELWVAGKSTPEVVSELTEYERVDVAEGGVDPRTASRISVRDLGSDSEIVLFLSDMNDGSRAGRLAPFVFDFDELLDAHRPARVVVLDEWCATSAAVR